MIIKGFGYNKYKTVLLSHPTASFQLVTVVAGAVLTTIFRKSRLIILTSMYIIAISGALMINRRRNRAQRVHIDAEERQKVDLMRDDVLPRVDETDMKNLGFRYIL